MASDTLMNKQNQNRRDIEMKTEKSDLMTAGAIAQEMGLPGAKVKKAIVDLKLKPAAKKGVCNYYTKDVIPKIKSAVK
jgi:predicted ArsR family transcriptional regulator